MYVTGVVDAGEALLKTVEIDQLRVTAADSVAFLEAGRSRKLLWD